MVFWSNLKKKISSIISRQEFDALKNKVDNDVVLKSMTSNTTITNTGNTIVSAPIVNLTSKSGDLELRVNNTSKSITCGGARIVDIGAPTANSHAANKQYVDTRSYAKSETYTKAEVDEKVAGVVVKSFKDTNARISSKYRETTNISYIQATMAKPPALKDIRRILTIRIFISGGGNYEFIPTQINPIDEGQQTITFWFIINNFIEHNISQGVQPMTLSFI